ncbi:MAG: hypothetical protein AB1757_26845 [Acidobacteriota bacterium]
MTRFISPQIRKHFCSRFTDEYCDEASLQRLCALDDRILERVAQVSESVLLERHRLNPRIIKLIKPQTATVDSMVGFYILYPINRECETLIESGVICQSRELTAAHLCQANESVDALYLSMVYGRTRQAQGYLIYLLYRDLKAIIKANRSIRYIYVRPVTTVGFQAVEKHAFHPIHPDSGIYCRKVAPEEIA